MNETTQPAVAGTVKPTVMQHTPGPWRDMKDGAIVPLKSVYCERLGFQIGFVNTDRKSVEAEARANAELIAAAPELLAALRGLCAVAVPSQQRWEAARELLRRIGAAQRRGELTPEGASL